MLYILHFQLHQWLSDLPQKHRQGLRGRWLPICPPVLL
uniref:Uncharacterized protein n=1 Tax=Siphoviridae sp. ctrfD19 TaxID=2826478 RepID=A0A8S5M1T1_9CAUD|nr:MAG TPA: hypothetical protein [Siphoviridae sp. ctrfD19]DAL04319.1 MAG TPA: hypothetical protein [Caudoviricetes sp.]